MYNYYLRCKYWFQEKQWEFYVIISLIIILGIFIYNVINDKKGSWSTTFVNNKNIIEDDILLRCKKNNDSKGEMICRQFLNKYFKKPFIKVRNLYNPVTNQYLELDCYNSELNLAVEYQGKQHYKYTPYFHKNFESFRNQQYRDELKRIFCKDLGITLIEVPYDVKDIEKYLYNKICQYY